MIEVFIQAFDALLYRPLFNFLVLLYNYLPGHDFGIAIIILTAFIRLILHPSSKKAIRAQRAMAEIQPKLQEIKKKYKDDKEKEVKETLALYKQIKINPLGSLLPTLIQLPLLIALYRVFWKGFQTSELVNLYGFVSNPGQINAMFLGLIDLSKPSWIFAIVAGILQLIQSRMMLKTPKTKNKSSDFTKVMQNQMMYFFPFLTAIILLGLPSALGLYWTISSALLITEQYIINRKPMGTDNTKAA